MRLQTERLLWVGGAALAATAAVVTTILVEKSASAAPAGPAAPVPAPQPVIPPGATYTTPITDPNTVKMYQYAVAAALAAGKGSLISGPDYAPFTSADYAMQDVDGNPANPKWTRIVATFQSYANKGAPFTNVPAGYPSALRTDGVLDYATAIMMVNS